MIIPEKLKIGDEVRIIAPSRSLAILSPVVIKQATDALDKLGLKVTFGKHVYEQDIQNSSSIASRIADLHEAFSDPNVKGILSVIGGYNSNELLPYIDYELIKANPKIFCGFSDITAIATAITARTEVLTYSGPHFSSFAMLKEQAYQSLMFQKCLMEETDFSLVSSPYWSDDPWFSEQEKRQLVPNDGLQIYTEGSAYGHLYGGNLCTLNLLQETPFMPNLENTILFIEDDSESSPETFARDLTSLLQSITNIKGLVIGKFQNSSKITEEQLLFILDKHPILQAIPVIYGANFGHTQPIFTFPIGGVVALDTTKKQLIIKNQALGE